MLPPLPDTSFSFFAELCLKTNVLLWDIRFDSSFVHFLLHALFPDVFVSPHYRAPSIRGASEDFVLVLTALY